MNTHDARLDRLRQIWAPPAVSDEVRVARIARELGRDVASVRMEIDELRARTRARRGRHTGGDGGGPR